MRRTRPFLFTIAIAVFLLTILTACSSGPRDPLIKSLGDETYFVPTGHLIEFFEPSSKQNLLIKVIDDSTVETTVVVIWKTVKIDTKTDFYYGVLGHVTVERTTGGMKIQTFSDASITIR